MISRVLCNVPNGGEAILPGDERALGFEAHITQYKVCIIAADIGWIAYDEVGALASKRRKPLTCAQLYVR